MIFFLLDKKQKQSTISKGLRVAIMLGFFVLKRKYFFLEKLFFFLKKNPINLKNERSMLSHLHSRLMSIKKQKGR